MPEAANNESRISSSARFEIEVDAAAYAWLQGHPSTERRVITYEVHRCCGGGRLCQVQVRDRWRQNQASTFPAAVMSDGTEIAIDPHAAARLPSRFGLTVRGFGPLRHLDLDLDSEEWAKLLYD